MKISVDVRQRRNKRKQKNPGTVSTTGFGYKRKNKEIIVEEMYSTLNAKYMEAIKMSLEQIGKEKNGQGQGQKIKQNDGGRIGENIRNDKRER